MKLGAGILGAALFLSACAQVGQEAPEMALPVWDGNQIVCNEEVSFAADATTALPEFAPDERLGFCARSMRYIALHRQFGDKTSYFGIAAATTASLAATYAPLVRRAYTASTWEFMSALGADIEVSAGTAAQSIADTGLLSRFSGGRPDTAELARREQQEVQMALDAFATEDPEGYAQLIDDINGTFNPTNRLLIAAINRNPFFRAYEAGLAQVRAQNGGSIDFSDIEQRVEISAVLQALIETIPPAG